MQIHSHYSAPPCFGQTTRAPAAAFLASQDSVDSAMRRPTAPRFGVRYISRQPGKELQAVLDRLNAGAANAQVKMDPPSGKLDRTGEVRLNGQRYRLTILQMDSVKQYELTHQPWLGNGESLTLPADGNPRYTGKGNRPISITMEDVEQEYTNQVLMLQGQYSPARHKEYLYAQTDIAEVTAQLRESARTLFETLESKIA